MNIAEAKAMFSPEAAAKLHEVVDVKPEIDFSKKVNNDILMTALCKAVTNGTIKKQSLNDRLIKLLNSETNTISQSKLEEILSIIHHTQPKMVCIVTMRDVDKDLDLQPVFRWEYKENISFNDAFYTVLLYYHITPSMIRQKMTETLKSTIVNNVSQLVSKYYKSSDEERNKMIISISTIQRLVNMCGGTLVARFKDYEKYEDEFDDE